VVVALYNASIMLWTTLKQHGQSQWVRSSYFWLFFVPVVAHSMSSLNEGTTLDLGDWHLELSMKLPFSWKLFYFGAVCFSLAGIVYYFFCPRLVRDYDRLSQFLDKGKGPTHLAEEFLVPRSFDALANSRRGRDQHLADMEHFVRSFTMGEKMAGLNFGRFRDSGNESEPVPKAPGEREAAPLEIIPDKLADAFWFARNAVDESRVRLRAVCTCLYVLGYAAVLGILCTLRIVMWVRSYFAIRGIFRKEGFFFKWGLPTLPSPIGFTQCARRL
jgi:hypothetical protein